ncbi:helix-turn-helix transcriptional regulator [Nonomuraea sp. NPDC048916]|uniref:AraC family transcriptional regulator n=1 Tax=Nonomuraea sp. NPDC048916 TaxID=3154232 RepID=UPI0033E7F57E
MTVIRHLPEAPTGRRPLAPGTGIDAHRHDTHQIIYACRGMVSVTTGAGTWVAPANRAIWIPAGTVHEHRAHGRTDLRLVGLPVTDDPLGLARPAVLAVGPLLRELIIAYTDHSGATGTGRPEPGGPEPGRTEPGRTGLDGSEADRSEPGGPEPSRPELGGSGASGSGAGGGGERGRLRAVLLDQLRHSPEQPFHLPTASDPRLAAVCAILHDDPADGRTLAQLGAAAGTSARTLARLCRGELGMSFPQWRTQLRLHHALLLLADGTAVTTVAHRCGWASASAFIDAFRRALGYTPGKAFTL